MEIEIDDVKYQSTPEIAAYDCCGCTFRFRERECLKVIKDFDCSKERVIWEIKQNMGVEPQQKEPQIIDKNVVEVVAEYAYRAQKGFEKYGTTTERTDIDLAGWLKHLQEELMDATVYIQRIRNELKSD